MNTPVMITFIICITLIVLVFISNSDKKDK